MFANYVETINLTSTSPYYSNGGTTSKGTSNKYYLAFVKDSDGDDPNGIGGTDLKLPSGKLWSRGYSAAEVSEVPTYSYNGNYDATIDKYALATDVNGLLNVLDQKVEKVTGK